jgi:hypothetical protein
MRLLWCALALFALFGCGVPDGGTAPQVSQTVPAAADRQDANGPVSRVCGSHYAEDFDEGVESRVVTAGPVSLLSFRVAPTPGDGAPVRTFKLMVRLAPGTAATIRTTTAGTSLGYDRARFRKDNTYRLGDGDPSVRFAGCPDRAAVFNGSVFTSGPRAVDLDILVNGRHTRTRVTAYQG